MLPPPAPIVCTSTIGRLSARPPTSRPPPTATLPESATDTSQEVPPMSRPTASPAPASSAIRAAPTAPPAGPEKTLQDAWRGGPEASATHPLRPGALRYRNTPVVRHERRRMARAEAVQLGARLAPELLQIGEAVGREQRRAGHPALEQGIGPHCHAVHEALDLAGLGAGAIECLLDGGHDSLGLVVGSGRRLAGHEPRARQQHGIGERAADID